jgi:hypothetical protein
MATERQKYLSNAWCQWLTELASARWFKLSHQCCARERSRTEKVPRLWQSVCQFIHDKTTRIILHRIILCSQAGKMSSRDSQLLHKSGIMIVGIVFGNTSQFPHTRVSKYYRIHNRPENISNVSTATVDWARASLMDGALYMETFISATCIRSRDVDPLRAPLPPSGKRHSPGSSRCGRSACNAPHKAHL